jgi:hypothetical protein
MQSAGVVSHAIKFLKQKKQSLQTAFKNSGWNMGLEPTTLGTTNRCSNQLS